jgi:molybdate/tungstate transport system substrate-binding protein
MSTSMRKCLILCLLVLLTGVPTLAHALTCPGNGKLITCTEANGAVVYVWHAGSLGNAFSPTESQFCAQTGISVCDYAAGSLDMVRQVTAGAQPADVVAPADYLDVDLFLKAKGYADYDIRFAEGKMVLAYCLGATSGGACAGTSKQSALIADTSAGAPTWGPPASPTDNSIPNAVSSWYTLLSATGVTFGGSHLYLDPSGYRAPMIFRLAQSFYKVPNLYDSLLEHYIATPATTGTTQSFKLGAQYDYTLTYQNNAYITSLSDPNYRYVNLPDDINLGNSAKNYYYRQAVIVEPDLFGTGFVPLPASRVVWGVTVLKNAPNPDNAIKFLQFLLDPKNGTGQTNLQTDGPAPIAPAEVSRDDYRKLPDVLKPLVTVTWDHDKCAW